MNSFLVAVEFLTRLSVRRTPRGDLDEVARSQIWFPAIGLLIGAVLVAIDRLAIKALPAVSVDVLLVVALALITGGLHLDGLADAADGLFGGYTTERRLEIMRDVHAGSFAIIAVVSALALKWAGLAALPPNVRTETLLVVPCAARFAMLLSVAAFPYARVEGMGAIQHQRAGAVVVAVGGATAAVAAVLLLGVGGVYALALAIGVALGVAFVAKRMVGGMTGDLYGATVEISEVALLLFIAAFADRGWIDAWLLG
jgi:adenosylcobinamide-GDP ribazoletransferase